MHADHYYLVGGMGEGFAPVTSSVAFDFEGHKWVSIPSPRRPRIGADLVVIDGQLFLVGGSSPKASGEGLESNPTIECFSPAEKTWSTVVEDLGMDLKHARAFELDGDLCVLTMHREGSGRLELVRVTPPSSAVKAAAELREF